MPEQEQIVPLPFPERGLDHSEGYSAQRELTTRTGTNVRTWEPSRNRARGGSRPGLYRFLPPLPTADVIQCLDMVVRISAAAVPSVTPWGDPSEGGGQGWDVAGGSDDGSGGDDPGLGSGGIERIYEEVFNEDGEVESEPFFETEPPPQPDPTDEEVTTDPVTDLDVRDGGTGWPPVSQKEAVTVSWSAPADIYTGTALSSTQLNATATDRDGNSVAGTFTYRPPSGTVLPVGEDHPLAVVFTPDDTTLYYPGAATANINVVASSPSPVCTGTIDGTASLGTSTPFAMTPHSVKVFAFVPSATGSYTFSLAVVAGADASDGNVYEDGSVPCCDPRTPGTNFSVSTPGTVTLTAGTIYLLCVTNAGGSNTYSLTIS